MSEQQTQKKKPLFRIIFCPKVGTDQYGKEILGPGRDVGSVWERNDPSKPPVIRYDFDIANMSSAGVTFLQRYEEKSAPTEEGPADAPTMRLPPSNPAARPARPSPEGRASPKLNTFSLEGS